MFAILGEIVFESLTSPDSFESNRTWEFAEHRVVEDRPTMQWMAAGLETIDLDFHFHVSFTNPTLQAAALIGAANDHSARALVFGNGFHRGYFVVTAIRTTAKQMSATGDLIAITIRARLREWAFESEVTLSGPPIPWFPLIGIAAALPAAQAGARTSSAVAGLIATVETSPINESSPSLSAPGVSPMLRLPGVAGLTAPQLSPDDVPPKTIVRAIG
jgi:phage protein U